MVDGINGINGAMGQVGTNTTGARPAAGYDGPRYGEPRDRVTLSARGKKEGSESPAAIKDENSLSPEEKQQVTELKKRDAEVKAHEQAHMSAGGGIVQGGAAYQYQHGPDGKMYAVGGEVKIDISPERTPEATIRKMQQVQRAAMAPAQPSATDRAVAARAAQMEAQARLQKAEEGDETFEAQDNQPATESAEAAGPGAAPTDPSAAPANAGAVPGTDPAVPGAGSISPDASSTIFSYNADLSSHGSNAPKPKGLKIDLVA